jgi:hypothetical protein
MARTIFPFSNAPHLTVRLCDAHLERVLQRTMDKPFIDGWFHEYGRSAERSRQMSQQGDTDFARDLIALSLGEAGMREFGQYPCFLAVQRAYVRSQGWPPGRIEVRALAEEALWGAMTEWLAGRGFPTGSACDTIEAAKNEGFDLVRRVRELLLPRQFLR